WPPRPSAGCRHPRAGRRPRAPPSRRHGPRRPTARAPRWRARRRRRWRPSRPGATNRSSSFLPSVRPILRPLTRFLLPRHRLHQARSRTTRGRCVMAKWLNLVLVGGCTGLLMMGLAAPKAPTVEAQKLVLKDKAGKVRATLGEDADGQWGLTLYAADGKPRA